MPRRTLLARTTARIPSPLFAGVRARLSHEVDGLRAKLEGALFLPSDEGYGAVRRGQGTTPVDDRRPALVVQPESTGDVGHALAFARMHKLTVAVRSGGHDLLGASTPQDGALLDLSRLTAITVDPAAGTVRVGGGVRAGALTQATAPHGLAPMLGMNPNVGVGGLTLGGGMGWLAGKYGATVDHLLGVELVTADGDVLEADSTNHPDLFWALRGGGGNFGVATAFTYRLQPVASVLAGDIGYHVDPRKFMTFLRDFLAGSPDELEIAVLFTLGINPMALIRLCWSGTHEAGERAIAPLRGFAPAAVDTVKPQSYACFATAGLRFETMFLRGGEFAGLTDPVIETFADIVDRGGPEDCMIGLLHYLHGALCRPPHDTPFVREPGHILYNIIAPWQGEARAQDKIDWARAASEMLRPLNARKIYVNYLSYEGGNYIRDAFPAHYDRLRAIKRRYDPDNIFRHNRNIPT